MKIGSKYYPTDTPARTRAFLRWRLLIQDVYATADVVEKAHQAYLETLHRG